MIIFKKENYNKKEGKIKYTYEEVKIYIESLGYILVSKEYINNTQKLILKDKFDYYYTIRLGDLKSGNRPGFVSKFNIYTVKNIKLWCKINNKPFTLKSDKYENAQKLLKWQCLKKDCQEEFEMKWNHIFSQASGCPYCAGKKITLSNCLATKNPQLALEWHPINNGNLTPYDVTSNSGKKVWWLCEKNHEWKTMIAHRNNGTKCPYCAGQLSSKDYNLLVNNPDLCKEWDYNKNKKRPEEYTPNSGKKVWWKCKECECKWEAVIAKRNSGVKTGCPQCNESKGEKQIRNILNNKKINFISQYQFNDLLSDLEYQLRLDFGILGKNNKLKFIIEYDGQQHYEWIPVMMTKEEFKKLQYHDQLKNEYCQRNNIPLLRIPYWEFDNIEQILNDWLNKYNT